jgi:MFS family permease
MMVWAAMLGTMCCSTSVILVNVGVFMKPLADSFSWSRGAISLSLSIAALSMAAANPFVGRLIDRFGVRPVLISSLIGYSAFVALVPALIGFADIWGLYVAYAAIASVGAGSNVIAYVRLLSGWFSGPMNGSRGLALGFSSAGIPLGATITAPLGVMLIDYFGWQGGYWGLALLPVLIGLPIAVFFIRTAPNEGGAEAGTEKAAAANLPGMTVGQAMRTRAFWLMMTISLLMASCLQGIGIHTAPLLSDYGISAALLAIILAADGALGIVGRIGAGFLFDRFFAPFVSFGIFAIAAVSAFAFAGMPTFLVAVLATLFITLGSGAESDFIGYVVGRYFGLRSYGQIFGMIYGLFMVGIALGPYLFGVAFDVWGDYRISFTIAGIGLALICLLLLVMPKFPDNPGTRPPA